MKRRRLRSGAKRLTALLLLFALPILPVFAADELPVPTDYPEGSPEAAMAALAEAAAPSYTIVAMGFKNTVTGEEHYFNPDIHMVAASLYKTPLNMIYAERIARGEMSWDERFNGRSYREVQQASLTYSDNPTSVSLLVDIGDWQGLRRNAAEYLGEDSEDTDYLRRTNRFTVREMVHCMDLLQTQSERFPGVLDCLKLSAPGKFLKTNDPPYEIAQKYGNLNEGGTFLHAAGVIYTEEPIAVCVMTYGPTDSVSLFSGFVELVTDYTEESIARRRAEEERLAEEKRRAEEERLAEEQAQREAEEERIRAAELAEQAEALRIRQTRRKGVLLALGFGLFLLLTALAVGLRKKRFTFLLLLLGCLSLPFFSLTGESGSVFSGRGPVQLSEQSVRQLRRSALREPEMSERPPHYTVEESAAAGPAADPACYGRVGSYEELQSAAAGAGALFSGDTLMLREDTQLAPGSAIRYYCDETILALVWQENCVNRLGQTLTATYAEVKIADGSQLRRKLSDDSYGSSVQKYPTELAVEANAVLALNGDFYRFQNTGIHVYDRTVYAWNGEQTDSCFVDAAGDLLFVSQGTLTDREAVERYVREHDVRFGVSFGPILLRDGQNVCPEYYWMGQSRDNYPRCVLCQLGERHYLAATFHTGASVQEVAGWLEEKGVANAYAMDGGQSAVIILGGELCNPMDQYSGSQRTMSDILYFCTALPAADRS